MAAFCRTKDASGKDVVRCFVKGAAPAVMSHASTALSNGTSIPWDDDLQKRADENVGRMGEEGLRVMAAAYRDLDPAAFDPEGDLLAYVEDVEMASIVAMVDPPREESKAAVADAQAAHIRVRMVTGDDVVTGAAIAKQLGIPGEAILGADFAALSERDRLYRIDDIGVVGRVAPEHKVLLAETLKKKGDVVAMTGDGVNDAPAIKAADIGIAMGSGTEVAKNAGRMILSDDNFATIVYAVEQGRKLYDNLNKYIRFVLLELIAFVVTFLGATLFNILAGQPFTPAQILWINFLVNAPFGVALGFDQESPGLMARRPRPRGDSILTLGVKLTCGLGGAFVAVANLLLIEIGKHHYGSAELGQSIALVGFTLMLVVAAFECRSETGTVFTMDTFNSSRMNMIAGRGDRRRLPDHAGRLHEPAARHDAADRAAVGPGTALGAHPARRVGARQVVRAEQGGAAGIGRTGSERARRSSSSAAAPPLPSARAGCSSPGTRAGGRARSWR